MLATAPWMVTLVLAALFAQSPYAGQEARPIKALSDEETQRYLGGEGMGLAKAAELNRHPGPRHVLELSPALQLTPEQTAAVQKSYDRMHEDAVRIGAAIVEAERALDDAFARAALDDAAMERAVLEIATLQGRLRATHLRAHLETRAVLTAEQVERYDRLRGYGSGAHDRQQHH
jgi:Spy/CpxP family protein refolding chaperone